jgi:hypothetical protein
LKEVEMTTSNAAIDRLVIRDLIENWRSGATPAT